MSWEPVRCVGRTYPTAPAVARCGCLGRAPSWWLSPYCEFEAPWDFCQTGIVPCRFIEISTITRWDPGVDWVHQELRSPNIKMNVHVSTRTGPFGWYLNVEFAHFISDVPNGFRNYRKFFPTGFPNPWPHTIVLDPWSTTGWLFNLPATCTITNVHYDEMAANMCLTWPP